ncbi:MAG: hypothetical protein WCF14_01410, partial [Nitrososphaeraceae archaeon]
AIINLSAMVHIKRRPMKKRVKFTDIILTEQELKFNKAFKKRHNLGLKGLPLYFTTHVLVNAK